MASDIRKNFGNMCEGDKTVYEYFPQKSQCSVPLCQKLFFLIFV